MSVTDRLCAVSCDRHCHGNDRYCPAHRARIYRHGDVQADIPLRPWYVDTTRWCSYVTAHQRVKVRRGPATAHACTNCGEPAREWAYNGRAAHEFTGHIARHPTPMIWSGDVNDYDPMCAPCHRRHDREARRMKAA
jgi:hypothetical protein